MLIYETVSASARGSLGNECVLDYSVTSIISSTCIHTLDIGHFHSKPD